MNARKWLALGACLGLIHQSVDAAEPTTLPAVPATAPAAVGAAPATLPPSPATSAPPVTVLTGDPLLSATTFDASCLPAPAPVPCPPLTCCDCLCGPPGRVWVSAEWLYWAAAGQSIPPLVTAAPPGTPRAVGGTLTDPNTVVLFGGQRYNNEFRSGFRLRAGMWLDECQTCGIEGDFFFLGTSSTGFTAASNGTQIITRPFTNGSLGLPGTPDAQLVSFPGVLSGSVNVQATSDVIGGGFNFIKNICCDPCGRFDLLGGFRYINLRDSVTITENLTALEASRVPIGTGIIVQDQFTTNNDFYGGLLGFNYERRYGRCFLGVRTSVALGVSHQEVTINGSTTFIPANGGAPTVFPGGLLAQPSNIGTYTNDAFAVVPEVGLRLGAQITPRLRGFVGYNWIYWSNVARAGDQIDLTVNTNQLPPAAQPVPGPAVPAPQIKTTDYWLQGISLGGELRF